MTETEHYRLNLWEPNDRMERTAFNDNSTAIDAALAAKAEKSAVTAVETALANYKTSNDAAVAAKADASALTAYQTSNDAVVANKASAADVSALSAALDGKGNCKIVHGSYVGTGQKGYKYPNKLTFEFQPLLVVLSGGDGTTTFLSGMATLATSTVFTWSGNSVSWYNEYGETGQFNESGRTYYYMAAGV